ncbi:hypothetical protein NL529_33900, partial [Klebsiella pneumoniae]|nr:hypothetical protein [Klebsiella pneumoniae]
IGSGADNVEARATTASKSACFTVQAVGVVQSMCNITIQNCRSFNAIGDAFSTVSTSSGVPDNVRFINCYAEGAVNSSP